MTEPNPPKIIDVAVPLPLDSTFHYAVPPEFVPFAVAGVRVLVPFGRRKLTGYVLGRVDESTEDVKEIIATTAAGEIAILPNHVPLISRLLKASLRFITNEGEQSVPVESGFIEVQPESFVTVLVDAIGE